MEESDAGQIVKQILLVVALAAIIIIIVMVLYNLMPSPAANPPM